MIIIVIDKTSDRLKKFCEYLNKLKSNNSTLEINGYLNVWGNNKEDVPLKYLEPGDINFIHANDEVNKYWDTFARDKCSNHFVVCFSGAGVGGLVWNNPKHFAFRETINTEEDIKTKWFLSEFIEAISNNELNPFDKLTNFDPILEAKLNLLHKCLTPLEKKEAEAAYKELIKLLDSEEGKNKVEVAFNEMKKRIGKDDANCFGEDYVTALENLRKSLLE
jgi:hypothetical protein